MNPLARERRSRDTRPQPAPATNHQPLTTALDPAPARNETKAALPRSSPPGIILYSGSLQNFHSFELKRSGGLR